MPLTLEQIIKETRDWPPEKVGELVDRLSQELNTTGPEIEQAWKQEIRRRLSEIEEGSVQLVDGEQVSKRVRRVVGR